MRFLTLSVLALGVAQPACASRQDAGSALVAAGMVTAVTAAVVTTHPTSYSPPVVSSATSRHGAAAAAGVGAGVALAALGAAVARERSPDGPPRPSAGATASNPVRNPHRWRLVRPTENVGDDSTESE